MYYEPLYTLVINLDRRPDRWQRIVKVLDGEPLLKYARFEAVDGHTLTPEDIDSWVDPNSGTYVRQRCGAIGCWLSHMMIYDYWSNHKDQQHGKWLLVLEDDALLVPHFSARTREFIQSLDPSATTDIILLGWYEPAQQFSADGNLFQGTHGYLLSIAGARKLRDIMPRKGRQQISVALDWQLGMWNAAGAITISRSPTRLVWQHLTYSDSDVQPCSLRKAPMMPLKAYHISGVQQQPDIYKVITNIQSLFVEAMTHQWPWWHVVKAAYDALREVQLCMKQLNNKLDMQRLTEFVCSVSEDVGFICSQLTKSCEGDHFSLPATAKHRGEFVKAYNELCLILEVLSLDADE